MNLVESAKHRLWVAGIFPLFFITSAYADTYNFFLKREKKTIERLQRSEPKNKKVQKEETPSVEETPIQEVTPEAAPSPWRLGFSAIYYPYKGIKRPFSLSDDGPSLVTSYGGLFSIGNLCSPYFLFNGYIGAHYIPSLDSYMSIIGLDLELYPFSLRYPMRPVDFAVLVGGSNVIFGVNFYSTFHVGTRISINLGHKTSLTATGRIASDFVMFESGLLIQI
jgi:hypothetical protein